MNRCLAVNFIAIVIGLMLFANTAAADVTVEVTGVNDVLRDNIRGMLSIVSYSETQEDLTEAEIRRLHARAQSEIRQALMPYGYYQPLIKTTLTRQPDTWLAEYAINPGKPVRVRSVDIQITGPGAQLAGYQKILSSSDEQALLAENQVLHHADYDTLKARLQTIARQHGYLDAHYTQHDLRVNPEQEWAEIVLHFTTGPQYYFGPVTFEQNTMEENFLREYLTFQPGEPFDIEELLRLQYALVDSDYFSVVQVEPLFEETKDQAEDRQIPIVVHLEPNEKHRYSVGLGYGTDTGPRISLSWDNRRVNQRGHHSSIDMQFSEVEDSFLARYFVPLGEPQREQIIYSFGATRAELGDTFSDKRHVGIARATVEGQWQQTAYLRYEQERNVISGETTETDLVIPGIVWSRVEADDPVIPEFGWRFLFELRGGSETLGSDSSFLQGRVQAEWVVALNEQLRFLTRAEVGATHVGSTSELPLSQRFFTGGGQSVRGFAYNSLGPVNEEGDVVGGRYLAVASVELERRFKGDWNKWRLAVFVDAGNAMNNWDVEPEVAAGFGVRWETPVGMLRIDLAQPLTEPGASWQLHLSLGPDL
ncbi:MAG TPA: autotransporter assembly complex family protein [Gammaproteobacteria bacterium]|nr:autotransporter assembly complex family protein [Gammaproteobacteria bacterium]